MNKILTIARREYHALVRTKAFLISLVMVPVFMLGGIVAQTYLSGRVDESEKKIVVLDGTCRLFAPLEALAKLRSESRAGKDGTGKRHGSMVLEQGPAGEVTDDERLALSERIRKNDIFAFVEINADALKPEKNSALSKLLQATAAGEIKTGEVADATAKASGGGADGTSAPVRIYSESLTHGEIVQWLMQSIQQVSFALRLQDSGLDPAAVANVISPIHVDELGLYTRSSTGDVRQGSEGARNINFFIPFVLVMLMFMSVMFVCQPMLNTVLEEKQQRIAEVLLGSASPFQLMMGKLLGNVGVALTTVALYMLGGYLLAAHYGYAELVPMRLMGWFVGFEVLACILYGSLFLAVGAACSDLKDAQSLLMPIMLILVFPLMVWFTVLQEPLSSFATGVSLFPLATPMLMLLRMGATPMVPVWQAVLGVALVLVTTVVCVIAAGRVFRVGILSQGKAPKLNELMRWVARG